MEKETEFVTGPLIRWFQRQKTTWKIHTPKHGASSVGWDIEARRKNLDLLIEAKCIDGPFAASFAGLVTAPLVKRPQHFMKRKYRSWCHGICWAIGSKHETKNTEVGCQ